MGIKVTGGVKVPQGKFSVGSAAVGFTANAVNFDGTNDSLNRGAELTGAADGINLLLSLWFNIAGADDARLNFHETDSARISSLRNLNNKIQFFVQSAASGPLWNVETTTAYDLINNPGWHHLLVATELDGTPVGQFYIDDDAAGLTVFTALTAGDIDWTISEHVIGARIGLTDKMNGDLSEFYLTDEYLDISVEANRRKFIDAAGKPVDLGADGSTPTGTPPLMFFSGATVDWHMNKGSGGGFTENGALTDAADSPSD